MCPKVGARRDETLLCYPRVAPGTLGGVWRQSEALGCPGGALGAPGGRFLVKQNAPARNAHGLDHTFKKGVAFGAENMVFIF